MTNKINNLLMGEEPREKPREKKAAFNPKFNVREEFVLWVSDQFPRLGKHAKKQETYPDLESRREEVYQAALGAVNHGVLSTQDCANVRLREGWKSFEEGFSVKGTPEVRAKSLEGFVKALKSLSISLGGDKHFTEAGQFLSGRGFGSYSRGKLKAFVYMVGDKDRFDTTYTVFDQPQEFKESLVLIGELTRLSEWEFKDLQRIASTFKGPEKSFIRYVDSIIPGGATRDGDGFGRYSGGYFGKYRGNYSTEEALGERDIFGGEHE